MLNKVRADPKYHWKTVANKLVSANINLGS